ncbi:MAG: hypothetical protein LCH54_12150 [Bacteroidetes bacterium]|nr:hypothetical protein [Bacteroidota bacterium]
MKIKLSILVYLFLMTSICFGQEKALGNFDISTDDSIIVFSFRIENQSGLFLINRDGTGLKKIVISEKDTYFKHPKFLMDGKHIIYLAAAGFEKTSSIFMCNTEDGQNELLFSVNEIITEISLTNDKRAILYCKANEFKASSPIGVAAPHGIDVYSFDLVTKKHAQITYLNAYGLSSVSEFDTENLLLRLEAGPESGMVFLSKKDGSSTSPILPFNNPRKDVTVYYAPKFSNKFNTFIFKAPNEIFEMSMIDFIAKTVYKRGKDSIKNMCLFYSDRKILFKTDGDENLHIISFDGTQLENIEIDIDFF